MAEDDLQGLREVLGDVIDITAVLAFECIFQVRCLHMDRIPVRGEAGTDDALAVQCLGNDAEETLNQRPATDADAVAKVAIALPTGRIVVADLSGPPRDGLPRNMPAQYALLQLLPHC